VCPCSDILEHMQELGVKLENEHWYKQVPKLVRTSHEGKVTHNGINKRPTEPYPNNKMDIIICDEEEGMCMLTDVTIPGDRNVIKKEVKKILTTKIQCVCVECKNKSDTSNNRNKWNHHRIFQKSTTENSHIGQCIHTLERANVKV